MIVSSIDKDGTPHNSCKGIVYIEPAGRVYILDLYLRQTYKNLKRNPRLSITAVDEYTFRGYSLKGKAKIIKRQELTPEALRTWDEKISSRITQRLIRNLHEEKGHPRHPESRMPKPEYMIVMEVNKIVDLTPAPLK